MCGPCPSLALPRRTLLPRHSHTDAHDCVHTSPCILWRTHTWHASTRVHTTTSTPAAHPQHLTCSSPTRRRRAVAASAPPQHARHRRPSASWSTRSGEQACGQRRGHRELSCCPEAGRGVSGCVARAHMHVRSISIPRSTSPHAAASAQPHRLARLLAHIPMHTSGKNM